MKAFDLLALIAQIDVARDMDAHGGGCQGFLKYALSHLPPRQRALADQYLQEREAAMNSLIATQLPAAG